MSGVIDLPGGFQVAPIMQLESVRAYSPSYGSAVDVLGLGRGRGNRIVVFTASPNDLTATLNAFGNPGTSNANRIKYRDCIRAGQCTIYPFDNLRGQSFFQLDTRVTKIRSEEHTSELQSRE